MSDEPPTPASAPSLLPPEPTIPPPPRSLRTVPPPVTRTSQSLPPLPAVEPMLDAAQDAMERKDWDAALEAFKKALFLLAPEEKSARASIYASIGEVKLAQSKGKEAELNFEKALGELPTHSRSLVALVSLAISAGSWDRVVGLRRKMVDVAEDAETKAKELLSISEILEHKRGDLDGAILALEDARKLRPKHVTTLERLRALYAKANRWADVVEVLDKLVDLSDDPVLSGAYRFAQGDIMLGRLRDEPRGLAFLEMCLADHPAHEKALSALASVRQRREEWAELARTYAGLVEPLAARQMRDRVWDVCRKLAVLKRDKLLDGPGAIDAFLGAVEVRPDDVESRAALAELWVAKGDRAAAVRELERAAEHAPTRVQTYRRLFELHTRAQRVDRAWLAATCLEELGSADVDHELLLGQFRTDAPIRPTVPLDPTWWEDLDAPGADGIVARILRSVVRVAAEARVAELDAKGKLLTLPEDRKQAHTSTASLVRTFVWASKVLGIPLCDLYALDEVPLGIAAVQGRTPATALGPGALSGRSIQELAFLAGRHLTYYRRENYALVFFPTLPELTTLVVTAVGTELDDVPLPDSAARLREAIASGLDESEKAELASAVADLEARGGTMDLVAWIRSVELTAHRAGLLLCGDLRVALREVRREERRLADLGADDKRADLLAFTASDGLGRLRERLGVAAHASQAR